MSPVAQISGVVDSTQSSHMDNTHINGGGGDGREHSGSGSGGSAPSANGHSAQQPQQQQPQPQQAKQENSAANKRTPAQKDAYWFAQGDNTPPPKQQRASLAGPNDLFFGEDDKSSGLSYKDREERLRVLRERQQNEKHQKLEELKEQAAAAQRFREQQENERRRRLDEIRVRDADRRSQVEERKRIIQQAEQDRREAVIRKNAIAKPQAPLEDYKPESSRRRFNPEREQRMESKRRNEKSNIVFAFGSSTPRMLDPRDSSSNTTSYFGSRRATSTTNVHLVETSISRRASECSDMDLSRKRATSAHSLDRKTDGEDLMTRSMTAAIPATAARRRTDLLPAMPSLRDTSGSSRSSPRHRSPGRALSLGRLDELARPRNRKFPLAPLHETTPSSERMNQPTRTMSKSMCHLGPRPAKPLSSGALDLSGPLDKGISRSSVSLVQPRMTRGETLRQKKLRGASNGDGNSNSSKSSPPGQGMRSGTVTPNSPSRPTSALSQGSNNSSQVSLRSRTSPRKPRPLSIAGSSLSSADKPRDATTLSRESRPMERKLSVGSGSSSAKPARAKSAGSDRSAPATPARTPAAKATTPKKTPSQVKAESAAKKAVEKSKTTPKVKSQKTTPLQSPVVESKPLPGATKEKRVTPPKDEKPVEQKEKTKEESLEPDSVDISKEDSKPVTVEAPPAASPQVEPVKKVEEPQQKPSKEEEPQQKPSAVETLPEVKSDEGLNSSVTNASDQEEPEKTQPQKAADKPVTGYASEEEYKAALAEKRRFAREAKEKELELERQKELAEEERERKEEEDFLKMMADQKKAEEERLKKAIEEADKNREEEAKRKEEEEKQRIEAERIEQLKRVETEERLLREEEERQARKSRVAAIMARTRGKGGSNTPTKAEAKTPSEEGKGFEIDMSVSMTDSMISNLEAVVEAQSVPVNATISEISSQPESDGTSQPSSGFSTEPVSDVSSRSSQPASSQGENTVAVSPPDVASSVEKQTLSNTENTVVDNVISGLTSVKLEEPHVNGDTPVPMDTTPTQAVDLLENFNTTASDVNTRNHNGVDSTPAQTSQGTDNLGSLDPVNSTHNITSAASNFEQIIDLGQTKLSNEDAVNSNPPSPFIAFEQNLNKKQSQENTSTVPDLLL